MSRLTLDGSLRIRLRLMLAKPRLRAAINSLTFIVARPIRHKGKENKVFTRIIRTPFGVLLPFVPTKQKSLHYLSFRQTVAHQEGNLISTKQSEWRNLIRNSKSIIILRIIVIVIHKITAISKEARLRDLQSTMTCRYKSSSYLGK